MMAHFSTNTDDLRDGQQDNNPSRRTIYHSKDGVVSAGSAKTQNFFTSNLKLLNNRYQPDFEMMMMKKEDFGTAA